MFRKHFEETDFSELFFLCLLHTRTLSKNFSSFSEKVSVKLSKLLSTPADEHSGGVQFFLNYFMIFLDFGRNFFLFFFDWWQFFFQSFAGNSFGFVLKVLFCLSREKFRAKTFGWRNWFRNINLILSGNFTNPGRTFWQCCQNCLVPVHGGILWKTSTCEETNFDCEQSFFRVLQDFFQFMSQFSSVCQEKIIRNKKDFLKKWFLQ